MELQNHCSCNNHNIGLTLGNSPYSRNFNNWIDIPQEEIEKLINL